MKHWPDKAAIEAAMNDMPVEMVHDLADEAFDMLSPLQLACVLASHALRQPRIIKMCVDERLNMRDST